ncbi:uncharacterized protein PHACADRAFT_193952 [Phanerochaete carnosa HHB-10118-sp]|uniref:Uncharacterized protein n=1 Tax=Phanerochaete carnosa (strain HHB-10118-sp) TaxID=650164 RepID=K5V1I1_PHACS|nr:uncharacterized protein PHACADRAFT_193952 [Phanerochaete carnosa HHB-10118-sp]EKM56336.1 hypothetical protein PHACADRAFT_193952 [Phanerochaete carnosa HHB-10118-sp]
MERTIGNLGQDIRQHSNVYTNLQQIALRRCQFNALKAMYPAFAPDPTILHGAVIVGNGYILLRAAGKSQRAVSHAEAVALRRFVHAHGIPATDAWLQQPKIARWARLHLPSGQNARSLWKESLKTLEALRTSRNVKFSHNSKIEYGKV